jgi:hypothetical protein
LTRYASNQRDRDRRFEEQRYRQHSRKQKMLSEYARKTADALFSRAVDKGVKKDRYPNE